MASRVNTIVAVLKKFYGALPDPPSDPFTLFVSEVLSNHSTPQKVETALAALGRQRALTPDGMSKAPRKTLEDILSAVGPYLEQRIRALKTGVEMFRRDRALPSTMKGPVPEALRALKGMPQMGEGGAYRMLLFPGGHPVLPVDARIRRVTTRLGYGERTANFSKTARSIREAVARELPDSVDAYRRAYVYFGHHGGVTCTETSPHCDACPLAGDCPYARLR